VVTSGIAATSFRCEALEECAISHEKGSRGCDWLRSALIIRTPSRSETRLEALLIYGAYLAPGALIVAWLAARHRRRQRANLETYAESVQAGLDTPPSLHPIIDSMKCIGCEACVHACPEFPAHRVLGVVRGKARLVSASDCIGHGACKTACPVGAIRLVYGTTERGVDIPQVQPTFETNVAGIYIAGELGGMGLIRNAVEQGRQAVDNIVTQLSRLGGTKDLLDLLIIGAGPAGLSAALAAKAAGLRYLAIDQDTLGGTVAHFPRRKLVMTAPAELALVGQMQFRETSKEALMEYWTDVAQRYRLEIAEGERAASIDGALGGFNVKTSRGTRRARVVLLALGRRGTPRKLGVPGENLPKVVYRLTDPAQYRRKKVLVVGGGDSALEAAIALAEEGDTTVTLSYRSDVFTRAKQKNRARVEAVRAAGSATVLMSSNIVAVHADRVDLEHRGKAMSLPNDFVIVCAGGVLPTPLLKEVGIGVETKYGTA
jgi:thioredoxin reductase/Pyruvate/2-oxoacid:ferredoxin oxidoreductase delta subunit